MTIVSCCRHNMPPLWFTRSPLQKGQGAQSPGDDIRKGRPYYIRCDLAKPYIVGAGLAPALEPLTRPMSDTSSIHCLIHGQKGHSDHGFATSSIQHKALLKHIRQRKGEGENNRMLRTGRQDHGLRPMFMLRFRCCLVLSIAVM